MTNRRFWGIMSCQFLVGALVALMLSGFQENETQTTLVAVATSLTLCFVICQQFRHKAHVKELAEVYQSLKRVVVTHLKKVTPRIRGD